MRNMKNQRGFTLIEIIAVLVILGILAAVAVPKYYDLQEEARRRAAMAAVSEAQARFNMSFGQELLAGRSCTDARTNAATTVFGSAKADANMGNDWTVGLDEFPSTAKPSQELVALVKNNNTQITAPTGQKFVIITPDCDVPNIQPN